MLNHFIIKKVKKLKLNSIKNKFLIDLIVIKISIINLKGIRTRYKNYN